MPRPRRRYQRSARRQMQWDTSNFVPATVTAGGQATADVTSGFWEAVAGAGRKGITVLRIIGSLRVNSTDATFAAEWAAGFGIIEEDSATAGQFPDPQNDADFNWLWWMARAAPPAAGSTANNMDIDSKAKRRFMQGDASLWFILNNADSTQELEFKLSVRTLYALP